jgi:hypothetical protein
MLRGVLKNNDDAILKLQKELSNNDVIKASIKA